MSTSSSRASSTTLRSDYLANYDEIAAEHLAHLDEFGHNPWMSDDLIRNLNTPTIDLVNRYVRAGGKLLDAGCGTGHLLSQLPAFDRYGCDISRAYLERAQAHGEVCFAAVEAMPYETEWFDGVVCTDVLEHVLDLNAAVSEILRVLKSGGILVVRVPCREHLEQYLGYKYRFVHLRILDGTMLTLMFDRVFGCDVLETVETNGEVVVAVRKP